MFPYCFHRFRWNPFTNSFKGQPLNFYRIPITAPIINPGWLRNNVINNITCYYSFLWFFVSALNESLFRSSCLEEFCNKGVLRKFHKIHRKTPASESPEACNFIRRETLTQVFSCEFCEISKNAFFYKQLWCLLLVINRLLANIYSHFIPPKNTKKSRVFWCF